MHYVKVINGVIVDGPKELSSSESSSPNSHWSKEQLKLNNFFSVDLTYDALNEKIDFANPIITSDSVTYPRIDLSNQEKKNKANEDIDKKRESEYPSIRDLIVALWEKIFENKSQAADDLQAQRQAVKNKYPKV